MGKRSDFERKERDFYPTPYEAMVPLLPHLKPGTRFDEPCAGGCDLVRHLEKNGHTAASFSDISGLQRVDALTLTYCNGDMFITNPPWDRKILHPLIIRLSDIAPTWLLFDADWIHTLQSAPFMYRLQKVVSVGRVKWIPDSKMTGKDNCAWHLFDKPCHKTIEFFGRVAV